MPISQLQPCCRAHCRTARCPPLAAHEHVLSFQLQPFWRAHRRVARWPPLAAWAQVSSLQLQPFCRYHCRTARWLALWLRMSTCPDSKSSHSGGAIAAMPSGLQQLLPHTTFLPMSDFPSSGTMHLVPRHGHARSDLLAARPIAAPAGLHVQQLGGACREGTRQDPLAGLCYIRDLTCRECPTGHPCTASRASRIGSMDLLPLSSPFRCLWLRL